MAMDFSKSKNNVLAKTLEKATESNASIVKDISLDNIIETPVNEFIFGIRDDDVRRLAEEIEESGFTGSIDVIDLHNGKYQVFSGHQRLHAVALLGWKTIPCTISDDIPEEELIRKLLASNILTRKITPLSYARAIAEYKEKVLPKTKKRGDGRERDNVAQFFNIAKGQVPRYEAILKMPKSIQELCDGFDFPYSQFVNATTFNSEQMSELEDKVIGYVDKNGPESISNNIINSFIEQIKDREKVKPKEEKSTISTLGIWGHSDITAENKPQYNENTQSDNTEAMMNIPFNDTLSVKAPSIDSVSDVTVIPDDFDEEEIYYVEEDVNNISLRLKKLNSMTDISAADKENMVDKLNECKEIIDELIGKL